jgi:BRCA1-associated protein
VRVHPTVPCRAVPQHHTETGHNYAIELATQRVWDYTGDCYVHRLIQNRVDGKMVEFADPNDYGDEQTGKLGEALAKSKHEQVIQEYEMLLTSTLDSQRHFYDSQLAVVAAEHERCRRRLAATEKKCAEQARALGSVEKDKVFMEQVNASMKANQADWQSRVSAQASQLSSAD